MLKPSSQLTHPQVLPILDCKLRPRNRLHPRYALVNIPTATPPRHSDNGLLHTVHTVDGWFDCHINPTLGSEWCEWEL